MVRRRQNRKREQRKQVIKYRIGSAEVKQRQLPHSSQLALHIPETLTLRTGRTQCDLGDAIGCRDRGQHSRLHGIAVPVGVGRSFI